MIGLPCRLGRPDSAFNSWDGATAISDFPFQFTAWVLAHIPVLSRGINSSMAFPRATSDRFRYDLECLPWFPNAPINWWINVQDLARTCIDNSIWKLDSVSEHLCFMGFAYRISNHHPRIKWYGDLQRFCCPQDFNGGCTCWSECRFSSVCVPWNHAIFYTPEWRGKMSNRRTALNAFYSRDLCCLQGQIFGDEKSRHAHLGCHRMLHFRGTSRFSRL